MLRILAWQMLLSNNGIINSLLKTLGFSGINLMNTPTAVVFGMVYDYLPFMILPIYNALVRIRKDLIEAARDLRSFCRSPFPEFSAGLLWCLYLH